MPGIAGSGVNGCAASSQHARTSSPSSGRRWRSRAQKPSRAATDRRKWRQVPQLVDDRWQTQHRDASGWGVEQCGQRHIMFPMVARRIGGCHAQPSVV
jgi:hypothetical protein